MTEQQVPKLAAALVEHQRHFAALPTEDAQWVIQNTATAIELFADAVKNRGNGAAVAAGALALLKMTELGEIAGKKTRDCFTDKKRYYYRDSDLDGWLPPGQPPLPPGPVSVYQMREKMTFREMAARAVEMPTNTGLGQLAAALKECGYLLTLPDIEHLVERQESGEDVGLRTDGYANFAFVEDAKGSVSVVYFHRYGRGWDVDVDRLAHGNRWHAEDRLLLRNSVAQAL